MEQEQGRAAPRAAPDAADTRAAPDEAHRVKGGAAPPSAPRWRGRRLRGLAIVALFAALGAALFLGQSRFAARRPTLDLQGRRPSIVLITLDTTRADRLGVYGGTIARTPNLDQLGAEGVVFDSAISPVPLTLPSHSSMMTGLLAHEHGVRQNGVYQLPEKLTTLAEALHERGYRTGAFIGSVIVAKRFGLAQGFDQYDDPFPLARLRPGIPERPAGEVVAAARAWLGENPSRPFFLWVHVYDAHAPYQPPEQYLERFAANPYEGEISYVDASLAPLLQDLRARSEPVLIAAAGDHGESRGEHGEDFHGYFVYDSVQRVPLILWAPKLFSGGRRVARQVGLPDLYPTLLEVSGAALGTGESRSARSLVPDLLGAEPDVEPEIVLETEMPAAQFGVPPVRALRAGRWKWIDVPRPELYDLGADPTESRNVFVEHEPVALQLKAQLEERLAESAADSEAAAVEIDPALRETLESLGYAAVKPSGHVINPALDPKDLVPVLDMMRQAAAARQRRQPQKAIALYEEMLRRVPTARHALIQWSTTALGLRDYEMALKVYQKYTEAFPNEAYGYYNLGVAALTLKRPAEARRALERALELEPQTADHHYALGVACLAAEDRDAGQRHLREYLVLAPKGLDADEARRLLAAFDRQQATPPR